MKPNLTKFRQISKESINSYYITKLHYRASTFSKKILNEEIVSLRKNLTKIRFFLKYSSSNLFVMKATSVQFENLCINS